MTQSSKILLHFKKVDPILYQVAIQYNIDDLFTLEKHTNYFERLCRSITGQQLSVKAAATIWSRFLELAGTTLDPINIVALDHDALREVGLSHAKVKYIKGIAQAVVDKEIDLDNLNTLSEAAAIKELTKLKGVGIWTAEMFCMFTLHHEDIFSVGDLGLRRAMEKLYNLSDPTNEALIKRTEKWSPYRTYACKVLWESLDNSPVTTA